MLPVLLFVIGLVLLIKGGDWFVDGAVGIAHRFNMPEILIGATVVSIGTTLPEVMVSAGGALKGLGSIAYGNALGSIICNTALIAAITITVKPTVIDKKSLKTPVIFLTLSTLVYLYISYFVGTFSRACGILLLSLFLLYMFISVKQALKSSSLSASSTGVSSVEATASSDDSSADTASKADSSSSDTSKKDETSALKFAVLLVVGAVLIAVGARLLIDNGTKIATSLGVPDTVIALTFIALGTSLPELVTAITSLIKGSGSLSLGNIIGANMFNMVLVSGISITLAPFDIPSDKLLFGINSSLIVDIPVMVLVSLIMIVPALIKGKMSRIQGILLLAIYAAFCVFQFVV